MFYLWIKEIITHYCNPLPIHCSNVNEFGWKTLGNRISAKIFISHTIDRQPETGLPHVSYHLEPVAERHDILVSGN